MAGERGLIDVQGLGKRFGYRHALQGLDFTVQRGERLWLLGANGSGKSTLLRLLCGLSKPSSGSIYIGGWQLPREAHALRRQVGLVAHRPMLYDKLTARENLAFFGRLYGLDSQECTRRSRALLQQLGLQKRADSLVASFSRGLCQRLSIARALLHEPDLLLLDEPYSGLDQAASEALDELLAAANRAGCTILLSTHQLERQPQVLPRALVLERGRIRSDGSLSSVEAQAQLRAAPA